MNLGKFSLSLAVKDLDTSLEFYLKLGFQVIDGGHRNDGFPDSETMKWRILENPSVKIGLFQGMFDKNILTFGPSDLLAIQRELKSAGIRFDHEAPEDGSAGHLSAILTDPDGNQIMFDQM